MSFTAYNLNIESELQLPELRELNTPQRQADVRVRFEKVEKGGLPNGKQLGTFLWAATATLWLQVPDVARFLVRNGNEILIDPDPSTDDDSIRAFLLGSAFGALLLQRGHLVLHGNAVQIGDRCVVCVGPSGAGKSTLAVGLMRRGYPVLADDVVPVDGRCRALPGFPRIKLWQDVADALRIDTRGLHRVRPNTQKFNLPVDDQTLGRPVPIRWVYILRSDPTEATKIDPIRGMRRFEPMFHNTYRHGYLNGMALNSQHLRRCGQLAGQIRLAGITRPSKGFTLEPMIEAILTDIDRNP